MMRPSPAPTLAEPLEHQERVAKLLTSAGAASVIQVAAAPQERYAASSFAWERGGLGSR